MRPFIFMRNAFFCVVVWFFYIARVTIVGRAPNIQHNSYVYNNVYFHKLKHQTRHESVINSWKSSFRIEDSRLFFVTVSLLSNGVKWLETPFLPTHNKTQNNSYDLLCSNWTVNVLKRRTTLWWKSNEKISKAWK